jgi:hypothetical protein
MEDPELAINNNLTCNGTWTISWTLRSGIDETPGGAQSYCCLGFVPSQISNTDSLSLLGDYQAVDENQKGLSVRGVSNDLACETGILASAVVALGESCAPPTLFLAQ